MASEPSAFSCGSVAARLLATLHPSRVVRHKVRRGAAVFHQGEAATAVFLLESGRVRLARALADGASLILHVAQAGESFAEALLSARTIIAMRSLKPMLLSGRAEGRFAGGPNE